VAGITFHFSICAAQSALELGVFYRVRYPMEQQPAPPENDNLTPKMQRFLAAYARCARINQAAETAKVAKQSHYNWLEESEAYRRTFARTQAMIGDLAEDACVERAIFGVAKPVLHQGQEVRLNGKPLYEREYSDQLLLALLRRLKPQEYREHTAVEVSGSLGLAERLQAARQRLIEMKRSDDGSSIAG
jgi:hypothetical protein